MLFLNSIYGPWSILETTTYSKSHKSIAFERSLLAEWQNVPQEDLCAAVGALPGRIKAVIKNKVEFVTDMHFPIKSIRTPQNFQSNSSKTNLFMKSTIFNL